MSTPLRDYQNRRVKRVRSIRMTEDEWHLVKVAARRLDVTRSLLVRTALLYYFDSFPELDGRVARPVDRSQ